MRKLSFICQFFNTFFKTFEMCTHISSPLEILKFLLGGREEGDFHPGWEPRAVVVINFKYNKLFIKIINFDLEIGTWGHQHFRVISLIQIINYSKCIYLTCTNFILLILKLANSELLVNGEVNVLYL